MPKLVTWMNNQRVGELTKLANGAHTFKYAPEWLASRYARPLSLSLPLQRGNITSDAVFNFFDNLLPDSPIVRDRIVKRYHAKSRQPFDLLSEIGRDSVGAVTLLPENETPGLPVVDWRNGWPCKKLLRIYSGWRQLSTHAILRHHFSISGPWRYGNTHQRSQTGNGA